MTSAHSTLFDLPRRHDQGDRGGIPSICSAHPMVIEAALRQAGPGPLLFEATCNQVNQDGGYTGMTPSAFRSFVQEIAACQNFPMDRVILGGDHLGPNPWRHLPADQAMGKALAMTRDYAAAGFSKIHLDASMACQDDPEHLPPEIIAARAAELAKAAEQGAHGAGFPGPAYVIGTEVPVPGGAAEVLGDLTVTKPEDAGHTVDLHRKSFAAQGLSDTFERVVALVVQPGVEFGSENIVDFNPAAATALSQWRDRTGGIVFEAHSTDYQGAGALTAMVRAGFSILKVGPGLTFALREALYGLDAIAGLLNPDYQAGTLLNVLETRMQANPDHWQGYYQGTAEHQYIQRHYSYSDRIRYYWAEAPVQAAVKQLFATLDGLDIPAPLISQYLASHYPKLRDGRLEPQAPAIVSEAIMSALSPYALACQGGGTSPVNLGRQDDG